jgi:hypothetical protein
MAEEGSGGKPALEDVTAPIGGDYTRATFEQVLLAVTGADPKLNLHGVAQKGGESGNGNGWFIMGDAAKSAAEAGWFRIFYSVGEKTYFRVNFNDSQFDSWKGMFREFEVLAGQLAEGRSGLLDVPRLREAEHAVRNYATWLQLHYGLINAWVNKLSSADSEFKGKAANSIREILSTIAWIIDDLSKQMMVDRTPSTPDGLKAAGDALAQFAHAMADLLARLQNLITYPKYLAVEVNQSVNRYLIGKGLYGLAYEHLVKLLGKGIEEYILRVIETYNSEDGTGPVSGWTIVGDGAGMATAEWADAGPSTFPPHPLPDRLKPLAGPLNSQATWDAINRKISDYLLYELEAFDKQAREHLARLEAAYVAAKAPLHELYAPNPPSSGGGAGPGGGPDGGPAIDFPEIDFPEIKFDTPDLGDGPDLPDLSGPDLPDLPDLSGPDLPDLSGPDLPDLGSPDLGDLGGGPNMPDLGALGGGSGLPDGAFPAGGFGDLPGLGTSSPGGAGGSPFLGGMPFPGPNLPGGTGRTGPNFPNLVDENGNPIDPNGNLRLPESPDFDPGAGIDTSPPAGIDFPAGGGGPDLDLPSSADFPLPGGGGAAPDGLGGVGGPDGLGGAGGPGAGFPGGGLGDAPAMGGAGGEGWADWTGQEGQSQNVDRQDAALSGAYNGLPMMPPPMIPPMMPSNQNDRERQTWLSEDEKVWGIRSNAGSGVIGLPADLAKEVDEQLAPTHVHVRHVALRAKAGGPAAKPAEATQDEAQQPASG